MSSVIPDPAVTDWIPLWNGGGAPPAIQPSVRVARAAALSIPNGAWTTPSYDTVRFDRGPSAHWVAGSPSRLTCQVAGTYAITGIVGWMQQAGGAHRLAQLAVNGNMVGATGMVGATIIGGPYPYSNPTAIVYLNVGDYVEMSCYQDSGSAISINLNAWGGYELSMAMVGGMQGPQGIQGVGVPVPVVNGQWIKGVGGAAVWSAITAADITGVGVVKEVGTTGLKAQIVPQVVLAFPANDGSGNSSALLTLPVAWPTSHVGFAVGYMWPYGHWNFTMKLVAATGLSVVTIMMNQAGGAQNMVVGGVSFGY